MKSYRDDLKKNAAAIEMLSRVLYVHRVTPGLCITRLDDSELPACWCYWAQSSLTTLVRARDEASEWDSLVKRFPHDDAAAVIWNLTKRAPPPVPLTLGRGAPVSSLRRAFFLATRFMQSGDFPLEVIVYLMAVDRRYTRYVIKTTAKSPEINQALHDDFLSVLWGHGKWQNRLRNAGTRSLWG